MLRSGQNPRGDAPATLLYDSGKVLGVSAVIEVVISLICQTLQQIGVALLVEFLPRLHKAPARHEDLPPLRIGTDLFQHDEHFPEQERVNLESLPGVVDRSCHNVLAGQGAKAILRPLPASPVTRHADIVPGSGICRFEFGNIDIRMIQGRALVPLM
nr:hypothetical protein [Kineobactrum salinum]